MIFFCLKYISSIGLVSGQPDPPRVSIKDVGATTAMVKVECDEKDEVKYNIKYKKER